MTRLGPHHADRAEPDAPVPGRHPTSSSTLPGLRVTMYRHAMITDHAYQWGIFGLGHSWATDRWATDR